MSFHKIPIVTLAIILLLEITACGPSQTIPDTPSPTMKIEHPTSTWTLPVTPTLAKTPTLSSPTYTLIPTLPKDLAYTRFENLLQTNGNCQLPCWWGITPGKTSFLDAQNILTPLSAITTDNGSDYSFGVWHDMGSGSLYLSYPDKTNIILMNIGLRTLPYKNEVSIVWISSKVIHFINTIDSKLVYDDQSYHNRMKDYLLPSILSTYGKPDQVIFRMDIIAENNDLPASLDMRLFYPEKGVFVNYQMYPRVNGDQVITCPYESFISLWLIPPSNDTSYQKILTTLAPSDWDGFLPDVNNNYSLPTLEKITDMNIETFYAKYREPNNSCLVTPRAIWPRS